MKRPDWLEELQPYSIADTRKALIYILTSVVPYVLLLFIMIYLYYYRYPYWIIMLLSVPAVGFFVRTFMIVHDCSHSAFVTSNKIRNILGHVCGILTLTPFFDWQRNHGIHHANVANLDKRGTGDVWTMTVQEYISSNFLWRLLYRIFRNPAFLFGIAPAVLFLVMYRFPQSSTRRKGYFSILITDLAFALIAFTAYYTVGLKVYLTVQLPVCIVAVSAGVWLFYIQHQFENVYWTREKNWDLVTAAMKGSSFYKLPAILRWFSGNIGYHNIHHLKPRISCYNLKQCYDNIPELHEIVPVTLFSSLKSLRLRLWDEQSFKLVGFKDI